MTPPVSELARRVLSGMPHASPMLMLHDVLEVGAMHIVCEARIDEHHILLEDGRVSGLFALELIAQSAAALMVHRALEGARRPAAGMLLGAHKITLERGSYAVGDVLRVRSEESWGTGHLAQFSGRVELDGVLVAEGSINVMMGPPPG